MRFESGLAALVLAAGTSFAAANAAPATVVEPADPARELISTIGENSGTDGSMLFSVQSSRVVRMADGSLLALVLTNVPDARVYRCAQGADSAGWLLVANTGAPGHEATAHLLRDPTRDAAYLIYSRASDQTMRIKTLASDGAEIEDVAIDFGGSTPWLHAGPGTYYSAAGIGADGSIVYTQGMSGGAADGVTSAGTADAYKRIQRIRRSEGAWVFEPIRTLHEGYRIAYEMIFVSPDGLDGWVYGIGIWDVINATVTARLNPHFRAEGPRAWVNAISATRSYDFHAVRGWRARLDRIAETFEVLDFVPRIHRTADFSSATPSGQETGVTSVHDIAVRDGRFWLSYTMRDPNSSSAFRVLSVHDERGVELKRGRLADHGGAMLKMRADGSVLLAWRDNVANPPSLKFLSVQEGPSGLEIEPAKDATEHRATHAQMNRLTGRFEHIDARSHYPRANSGSVQADSFEDYVVASWGDYLGPLPGSVRPGASSRSIAVKRFRVLFP